MRHSTPSAEWTTTQSLPGPISRWFRWFETCSTTCDRNRRHVRGTDAPSPHWTRAREGSPDSHFGLVGVSAGVDTLVLHYRTSSARWSMKW